MPSAGNPSVVVPSRFGTAGHTKRRYLPLHFDGGCYHAVVHTVKLQRGVSIESISRGQRCGFSIVLVGRTEITGKHIAPFVYGLSVPHFFAGCAIGSIVRAQPDRQIIFVAHPTGSPWTEVKRCWMVYQQQGVGPQVGQFKSTNFYRNAIGNNQRYRTVFLRNHGYFVSARVGNEVLHCGVGNRNVIGGQVSHLHRLQVAPKSQLHLCIAIDGRLSRGRFQESNRRESDRLAVCIRLPHPPAIRPCSQALRIVGAGARIELQLRHANGGGQSV